MLRSLTPAEQLAGYDQAIRNLTAKLDQILRANDDPSTIHQLEGAIAALRAIVSNVASNDALARLSDDVHALSAKVDQLTRADDRSDSLAMLEQRIAALTSSLESREQRPPAGENSEQIERALAGPVRSSRPHAGRQRQRLGIGPSRAARILFARTAGSFQRSQRPAISDGSRKACRMFCIISNASTPALPASITNSRSEPVVQDSGLADLVKRELSDIRFSQAETDRQTQDSLEAVHSTLGHVVDRLSMIEGDLRTVRAQPAAPSAVAAATPSFAAPAPPIPSLILCILCAGRSRR